MSEQKNEAVANKIRELRRASGITQKDLANAIGVSVRQIQRIESGSVKVGHLPVEVGMELAKKLDVEIECLI